MWSGVEVHQVKSTVGESESVGECLGKVKAKGEVERKRRRSVTVQVVVAGQMLQFS